MNYTFSDRDSNGVTFENPSDAEDTLRLKRATVHRVISGTKIKSIRSEVVIHRMTDPLPGCSDPCVPRTMFPSSVRLIISGPPVSKGDLKKMLDTGYAAWVDYYDKLAVGGLPPTNAEPRINPTVTIAP